MTDSILIPHLADAMVRVTEKAAIAAEALAGRGDEKAADAAAAMGITAKSLKDAGLIDQIIREPLGSAYRDVDETARNIKQAIVDSLEKFETMGMEKLLEQRYARLTSYGEFLEESAG